MDHLVFSQEKPWSLCKTHAGDTCSNTLLCCKPCTDSNVLICHSRDTCPTTTESGTRNLQKLLASYTRNFHSKRQKTVIIQSTLTENSRPIKPHNFGRMHVSFLRGIEELHSIQCKKPLQEKLAQDTCTCFSYNFLSYSNVGRIPFVVPPNS